MKPLRLLALLLLGLLFWGAVFLVRGQRQDLPAANDHVLSAVRSPNKRLVAYLVMRQADSLSADVMKVFVASSGKPWHEGRKVMEGRRFSELRPPLWLSNSWLCIPASADGVEEREERVALAGTDVRIQIEPTVQACLDAEPAGAA